MNKITALLEQLGRWQQRHALLLFLAFGALLFGLDRARQPMPLPDGLNAAALEEEVLYRQARALRLDDGDLIVRRRLVQKMRQLLELGTPVDEPDEAALMAWVAADPARYGTAPRLSLSHRFIDGTKQAPEAGPPMASDPHPAGTQLHQADPRQLQRLFGGRLAERIAELPVGEWQGPLAGPLGQHYVRIDARELPTPDWEQVRIQARRDYLVEQRREQARLAVERLLRDHRAAS